MAIEILALQSLQKEKKININLTSDTTGGLITLPREILDCGMESNSFSGLCVIEFNKEKEVNIIF